MKPYILITNDDGIQAPGLRALWEALLDVADTVVVAPADDQSATGMSITLRTPISVEKHFWEKEVVWSVRGTPADTVKMALSVLLERKPDMIVSGINNGSNAGRNILYSGTVSAVIEGTMRDIPGIAFSCHDHKEPDYALATQHIPSMVRYMLDYPLPTGTLLNVTFPEKKLAPYKGIKLSRQGLGYWRDVPSPRKHSLEQPHWRLGMEHAEYDEHEESDIAYLRQGYISTVPLFVKDLTHRPLFEERKQAFDHYFSVKN